MFTFALIRKHIEDYSARRNVLDFHLLLTLLQPQSKTRLKKNKKKNNRSINRCIPFEVFFEYSSMEGHQSSSQVSLNTKRISAMIDSLHQDQKDEELLKKLREPSPVTTPKRIQHPHSNAKVNAGSPTKLPRSAAGNVALNSPDKDYRASMLSNYSGIVQEGVGVSYMVKNPHSVIKQESRPQLPTFPSAETVQASSRKPTGGSEDVVIKKVGNVKTGRGTSNPSADDYRSGSEGPKQGSLKLLSINNNKRTVQPASSIGSGNMASGSETSFQNAEPTETPKTQQKDGHFSRISTPCVDSDADSIATSIIPEVTTTMTGQDRDIPPVRSETSNYNPAIPPRSRNRPLSKYLLQDDGEMIKLNENEEDESSVKRLNPPTRRSSVTNNSETYYSATSFDAKNNKVDIDLTSDDDGDEEVDTVNAYLSRPLPTVPQPAEVHRDSTVKREQGREPEVVTTLTSASVRNHGSEDSDDQYEYIDESGRVIENPTPQTSPSSHRTKSIKNRRKKQQELRQFDVDTLSQLLNVTKGTLIGAEFADLGMKIEEKRALERLVDSLSRLTADMVLDPDRYEEGLKRLNKATKALEGF